MPGYVLCIKCNHQKVCKNQSALRDAQTEIDRLVNRFQCSAGRVQTDPNSLTGNYGAANIKKEFGLSVVVKCDNYAGPGRWEEEE